MHQLTKDPASLLAEPTPASPERRLSQVELVRYLDYCSEMLSLAAKVAAVYAQSTKDPQVVSAASDVQQLTANLSAKVWQKIQIANTTLPASRTVQPGQSAPFAPSRAAAPAAQAADQTKAGS
jgi:hypothetical protein